MGKYIENALGRGESVAYTGKINWTTLAPHIVLAIAYGLGVITGIPSLIRLLTTELGFTSRRVIGKTGLVNTRSLDAPLNKINNVAVERSIFGKILGYGMVSITTSSGDYAFKGVKNPEALKSALMQQIDEFEQDRIRQQATEMAKAMKS